MDSDQSSRSKQIRDRQYFSGLHLDAAIELALRAFQIEAAGDKAQQAVHRAFVLGSVISSVSFLEAAINEFLSDTHQAEQSPLPALLGRAANIAGQDRERIARLWSLGVARTARYKILDKYEIALALLSKPKLDHGRSPYQDVKQLVALRNDLVHFEPKWRDRRTLDDRDRFFQSKFPANKLLSDLNISYFPALCLGYGCAHWAVRSTRALTDEFCKAVGSQDPPWYQLGDDRISLLPKP